VTGGRLLALVAAAALVAPAACGGGGGGPTAARRATAATATTAATAAHPPPTGPVPRPDPSTHVYAATMAGDLSPAVAGDPTRVYVPNSEGASVDVIDPATFTVVEHFDTGRNPQHVTPSWDLRTLYVDNDLGDSLTPIDPRTGAPGPPIPVVDPYNLYFTPDGSTAIVVAERLRRLDFRDAHSWALLGSVAIPHAGPDHLDFTADGRYLLISCEFSGWLVKVDVAARRIVGQLQVGGSPVDVRIGPDGTVFYVANQKRNGVSVVDPVAMREVGFVATGRGAHGLYPSRDGASLYVTNRLAGSVSVLDLATGRVTATWTVGGSPDMGGVSADGRQLWLSGRYDAAVYVIDTRTGALVHTIPVGRGPHGLCLFPQPGRFSLGHTGNYR
jgi:YVTN family beta-propeller protein